MHCMDGSDKKQKGNELLINWSKWLITINVFADTGCIIGLKTSGEAIVETGILFFCAISSFTVSIIIATLFVFLLAKKSLYIEDANAIELMWMAKLQWVLFILGLIFLLLWIGFLSKAF
jgi:hypothetical protein